MRGLLILRADDLNDRMFVNGKEAHDDTSGDTTPSPPHDKLGPMVLSKEGDGWLLIVDSDLYHNSCE